MFFILVLTVLISMAFGGIRRGAIDEGCTGEFPVWGRPLFEAGELRCRRKSSFVRILYPSFQSLTFEDLNQSCWVCIRTIQTIFFEVFANELHR